MDEIVGITGTIINKRILTIMSKNDSKLIRYGYPYMILDYNYYNNLEKCNEIIKAKWIKRKLERLCKEQVIVKRKNKI